MRLMTSETERARFDWQAVEDGYISSHAARRDQIVCVCGGYSCGAQAPERMRVNDVEVTNVAISGRLRPRFLIINDPEAGTQGPRGRQVVGGDACVQLRAGERLGLALTEEHRADATPFLTLSFEQ